MMLGLQPRHLVANGGERLGVIEGVQRQFDEQGGHLVPGLGVHSGVAGGDRHQGVEGPIDRLPPAGYERPQSSGQCGQDEIVDRAPPDGRRRMNGAEIEGEGHQPPVPAHRGVERRRPPTEAAGGVLQGPGDGLDPADGSPRMADGVEAQPHDLHRLVYLVGQSRRNSAS